MTIARIKNEYLHPHLLIKLLNIGGIKTPPQPPQAITIPVARPYFSLNQLFRTLNTGTVPNNAAPNPIIGARKYRYISEFVKVSIPKPIESVILPISSITRKDFFSLQNHNHRTRKCSYKIQNRPKKIAIFPRPVSRVSARGP